jgi:hypothetical protein
MEKKLEDTGQGKALYMMSVFKNVITGANLCQISATLDVESQHKDGKAKLTYPKKGVVDPCILSSFLSIAAKLQSLWRFLTEHA